MLLRQRDARRRGLFQGDVVGKKVGERADGWWRGTRRREEGAGVAVLVESFFCVCGGCLSFL